MRIVRVKICGITRLRDALAAVNCGASALGFIFYKKSPRYIFPAKAREIIAALPPFVIPVGIFVNASELEVKKTVAVCSLKTVQFHGDEPPSFCRRFKELKTIKAVRISETSDFRALPEYPVDAVLLDTFAGGLYGGTGRTFDWTLADKIKRTVKKPIILSGGINCQNVVRAVRAVLPYAVDVSSGVESRPGIKDHKKLIEFFDKLSAAGFCC